MSQTIQDCRRLLPTLVRRFRRSSPAAKGSPFDPLAAMLGGADDGATLSIAVIRKHGLDRL